MLPAMEVMMVLPEMLDPTSKGQSRVNRVHARAVKESLRIQLEFHHRRRIPEHFNFFRQKKYNYKPRSPRTIAAKRRAGRDPADIVKTGSTKNWITRTNRIRVGGSIESKRVTGTLQMKMPPGMKDGATPITVSDLKAEILKVAPAEEIRMIEHFKRDYNRLILQGLKPRTRVRMAARLGTLGIR